MEWPPPLWIESAMISLQSTEMLLIVLTLLKPCLIAKGMNVSILMTPELLLKTHIQKDTDTSQAAKDLKCSGKSVRQTHS